jgi:hypothetical protein
MIWLALGLTTLLPLLLVWVATQESRGARILGAAAVLVHPLILLLGQVAAPSGIWTSVDASRELCVRTRDNEERAKAGAGCPDLRGAARRQSG